MTNTAESILDMIVDSHFANRRETWREFDPKHRKKQETNAKTNKKVLFP
jgi:hypothetical protein